MFENVFIFCNKVSIVLKKYLVIISRMISKTSEQEHINGMGKPNILFYDRRLPRLGLGSVSVAQLNICTTLAKTFFLAFPIC